MPETIRLRNALARPGGESSDFDLNPAIALPPGRVLRPAAVLVAMWEDRLILTKRASHLKHMAREDLDDIHRNYQRLSRMKGGGCTVENLLSTMDEFMRQHPEIVHEAFDVYNVSHSGVLSEDEFFEMLKFCYPPFARTTTFSSAAAESMLSSSSSSSSSASFSLDSLADARWKVIKDGLGREIPGHTTVLLGTRDCPPLDRLKYRFVEEYYRRHGDIPEIHTPSTTRYGHPITLKQAQQMFAPRITTKQRVAAIIGQEFFSAEGEFSPERASCVSVAARGL